MNSIGKLPSARSSATGSVVDEVLRNSVAIISSVKDPELWLTTAKFDSAARYGIRRGAARQGEVVRPTRLVGSDERLRDVIVFLEKQKYSLSRTWIDRILLRRPDMYYLRWDVTARNFRYL